MQDAADSDAFVETWFKAWWLDHLRHYDRVSQSNKAVQDRISSLHRRSKPGAVSHHLAAVVPAAKEEEAL